MTQQNINLGSYPNDANSDSLWVAFPKVQANFVDLYSISRTNIAFLAWVASLPTTLPLSAGVAWNNSGVPMVSQP